MTTSELIGKPLITTDTNIAFTLVDDTTANHVFNIIDMTTGEVLQSLPTIVNCRLLTDPERRRYFKLVGKNSGYMVTHYTGSDRTEAGTILSFSEGRYLIMLIADIRKDKACKSSNLINAIDTETGRFVAFEKISNLGDYTISTPDQHALYFRLLHNLLS